MHFYESKALVIYRSLGHIYGYHGLLLLLYCTLSHCLLSPLTDCILAP